LGGVFFFLFGLFLFLGVSPAFLSAPPNDPLLACLGRQPLLLTNPKVSRPTVLVVLSRLCGFRCFLVVFSSLLCLPLLAFTCDLGLTLYFFCVGSCGRVPSPRRLAGRFSFFHPADTTPLLGPHFCPPPGIPMGLSARPVPPKTHLNSSACLSTIISRHKPKPPTFSLPPTPGMSKFFSTPSLLCTYFFSGAGLVMSG